MAKGRHITSSSIKRHAWRQGILVSMLVLLVGCSGFPKDYSRFVSYAPDPDTNGRIARITHEELNKHPGKSGLYSLEGGQDSLVARLALVDAAERSLDIQYYIWHQDATGLLLLDRILQAADRGVQVRLLLDDLGNIPTDETLLALATHPNISIRIFNPTSQRTLWMLSAFLEFERINGRMHNKSLTADSQVTIIGGRNIGDEYFENHEALDFGDLDVLAIGPVVRQVVDSFDIYWNSVYSIPIVAAAKREAESDALKKLRPTLAKAASVTGSDYVSDLSNSPLNRILKTRCILPLEWGVAHALYDEPEKVENGNHRARELMPLLEPTINRAREEVVIVSSYFIPGKEGVKLIRRLRNKGITVRVITNSITATDVFPVHANYAKYRKKLLRMGVELYEIKSDAPIWSKKDQRRKRKKETGIGSVSRSSLHTKAFIFDRKHIFIGSLNLDPRSIEINTEIGLLIESESLATDTIRRLDAKLPVNAYRLELKSIDPDDPIAGDRIEWVTTENGKEVRYRSEPFVSPLHQVVMWFVSLPPFESQF